MCVCKKSVFLLKEISGTYFKTRSVKWLTTSYLSSYLYLKKNIILVAVADTEISINFISKDEYSNKSVNWNDNTVYLYKRFLK